jgi:6-phosphofructokinase 1
MTRIGVLTGGGDVPGLNPCIKTLVYAAADRGYEVVGLRRGWAGLLDYNLDDDKPQDHCVQPLTKRDVRTIDRTGGTFLHTSRTNPGKVAPTDVPPFLSGQGQFESEGPFDFTSHALAVVERLGLDWLVAIGGDDTLSYAERLSREGVKTLAVPKTMDNDVFGTDYCIGFSTAVTRAIEAIERQRTTVGSHERIGIFRVFGRDAGHTALYTSYVTSLRCCIPEYHVNLEKLIDLLMADKRNNPSNYALVILSEGAEWEGYTVKEYGEPDAYGHRKKMSVAEDLSAEIKAATGEETVVSDLTYELRSGSPDFVDRMVAITFAGMAMDGIQEGRQGLMTAVSDGRFVLKPIPDPALGPRRVDVSTMYNVERYRPTYERKLGLPIFLTRA